MNVELYIGGLSRLEALNGNVDEMSCDSGEEENNSDSVKDDLDYIMDESEDSEGSDDVCAADEATGYMSEPMSEGGCIFINPPKFKQIILVKYIFRQLLRIYMPLFWA